MTLPVGGRSRARPYLYLTRMLAVRSVSRPFVAGEVEFVQEQIAGRKRLSSLIADLVDVRDRLCLARLAQRRCVTLSGPVQAERQPRRSLGHTFQVRCANALGQDRPECYGCLLCAKTFEESGPFVRGVKPLAGVVETPLDGLSGAHRRPAVRASLSGTQPLSC